MSGHSKWSQIKRKKGIADQKRGQLFSKLSRVITLSVREGRGITDPENNLKLRLAVERARAENMPKENIERAIKRASDKDASVLKEVLIQAMGPSGIAMVIEGITDNSNRTVGDVRTILSKNDFKIVPESSLNWMFDKEKNPTMPLEITDEQLLSKIDKLLEELDSNDDVENVYTNLAE